MTAFLFDTNVWVALAITAHAHHDPARGWLETTKDSDSWVFCRSTQQSLLRVLTQASAVRGYLPGPLTNGEAWAAYRQLSSDERVVFRRDEPPDLERWWLEFSLRDTASPKLWMDAYLAAFARAGGYQLVTFDAAFRQFEGLDVLVLQADR